MKLNKNFRGIASNVDVIGLQLPILSSACLHSFTIDPSRLCVAIAQKSRANLCDACDVYQKFYSRIVTGALQGSVGFLGCGKLGGNERRIQGMHVAS